MWLRRFSWFTFNSLGHSQSNILNINGHHMYRITKQRIQIEKNIQWVTEQHINTQVRCVNYRCCSVMSLDIFSLFGFQCNINFYFQCFLCILWTVPDRSWWHNIKSGTMSGGHLCCHFHSSWIWFYICIVSSPDCSHDCDRYMWNDVRVGYRPQRNYTGQSGYGE